MTLSREDLRRFVGSCDPNSPLTSTDPRYVSLDEVRGRDGSTCVELLEQTVTLLDESCQIFTGFPGTGKTTELRRLQQRLQDAADLPTHVVYVDFEDYLDVFSHITIADVLRVTAYCLDREATEMEGNDPDKKPGYVRQLIELFKGTEIEVSKIDLSTYGPKLMLEFKNNPDFYRRAEDALSRRFQTFVDEAQQSMHNSVVRLKKARGAHAQRVVVIADGLEKIRPRKEDERSAIDKSIELLFSTHARLLRLPCHVIYTFPLWLRYQRSDLGASYDGEPLVLPMVKVTTRDRSPEEKGIEQLATLVRKRVDLQAVFGPDPMATLRSLILASGGYPRDLLRMVRNLLVTTRTFPIQVEDASRVMNQLAESYGLALFGDEIDVLVEVADTHAVPMDDHARLGRFLRLLDRYLVLAYRNGKEWYDVHPMVRRDPRVEARMKKTASAEPQPTKATPER